MKTIVILTQNPKINTINTLFRKRDDMKYFGELNNYFYKYNIETNLFENQETFSQGLYLVYDEIENTEFNNFFNKNEIIIITHQNSVCIPDENIYKNIKPGKHESNCPIYPNVFDIIQNDSIKNKIDEINSKVLNFDQELENYHEKLQLTNLCEDNSVITKKVDELNQYIENKK